MAASGTSGATTLLANARALLLAILRFKAVGKPSLPLRKHRG
jgi:hypothetical protein